MPRAKRRGKPKRVSPNLIFAVLALIILLAAAAIVVMMGREYFRKHQPLASDPDKLTKQLALEAKSSLSGEALHGLGRLGPTGKRATGRGEIYSLAWTGYDDTSLILAEKAVEDAWRTLDPKIRIGIVYPDHPVHGERVWMVAGVTVQPLVELLLYQGEPPPAPPPKPPPPPKPTDIGARVPPPAQPPLQPPKPEPPDLGARVPSPAQPHARIALIIDDIGNDLAPLNELLAIDVTLTFSVLPDLQHTREAVDRLTRAGAPIMLHMPMQPVDFANQSPGPGALLLGMDAGQIQRKMEDALSRVPGARGFNNHMGSAFTTDSDGMEAALTVAKEHNLFFIDSKTTGGSVGLSLARKLGVPAAERQVFLDHTPDPAIIRDQLKELARKAAKNGIAVGIGHPYPETIAVLKSDLPDLAAKGYEFVPAEEAVK